MGVIKRQGITNTITTVLGIAIGMVSLIFIQPQFLTKEELGLTRILYSFSMLVAMFVPMGIGNATIKYFPLFKDEEKKHHGYFAFMMIFPLLGFLLAAVLLWAFKDFIAGQYAKESYLFTQFYFYVFPLTFIIAFIACLNVYCFSNYKSTVPAFLNDVVARVMVIVVITIYYLKWITLHQFIFCYVALFGLQLLMLFAYILYFDKLSFKPDWKFLKEKNIFKLINYGFLLWFAGVASIGLKYLDSLLIGKYLPIGMVGIYTVAAFIPTVIEAPLSAIEKIAASKISFAWAENNRKEILEIYRKSSYYMMALGGLLFLGINCNIDALLSFLPEAYRQTQLVVLIISIGTLINMATGLNAPVLFNSNKYRYGAVLLILLALVALLLQTILIPAYGLTGAATATAAAYIFYNMAMIFLVWKFFELHPFSKETIRILLSLIVVFAMNMFIPHVQNVFADILLHGMFVLVSYIALLYVLKSLPEVETLRTFFKERKGE